MDPWGDLDAIPVVPVKDTADSSILSQDSYPVRDMQADRQDQHTHTVLQGLLAQITTRSHRERLTACPRWEKELAGCRSVGSSYFHDVADSCSSAFVFCFGELVVIVWLLSLCRLSLCMVVKSVSHGDLFSQVADGQQTSQMSTKFYGCLRE